MGQTLYFPPSGFGFWYYLGQYRQISNKSHNNECVGASSGALLCIITLFDNKDDLFETIKKIALEVLVEHNKQTYFLNLHILNTIFIDKLFLNIDLTKADLSKLRIVTTKISFQYWIVPVLQKRETVPTSLEQLREVTLASTYVPFISNHNYKPYYTINDEHFIDGGIIDYYIPSAYFSVKPGISSLVVPTLESVHKSYLDGLNSKLTIHIRPPENPEVFMFSPFFIGLVIIIFTFKFVR
jgi:hypothetical protein